jgi:3-deoxy-manno-octulosonate cytidylyltransferase (CMP-KDO synthetase)
MNRLKTMIVIPARMRSTRLPNKMLLAESGKPLIQHTYESASRAQRHSQIVIATDHPEIAAAVKRFGGEAIMTDVELRSGTDRVAAVAEKFPDFDLFINVQGDEPEISALAIDLAIELLETNSQASMSTLATPIRDRKKLDDPNCVKVVLNAHQEAIYFSRAAIPFPRQWHEQLLTQDPPLYLQHVGLYGYRREFLLNIAALPASQIEQVESLEQLRVLYQRLPIVVGLIDEPAIGIDTRADYQEFLARHNQRS